jgi:hypothetical protein
LLRINEYANSGLLVQHVVAHQWGVSITVPFSKTSLVPTTVDIIRRDDQLCPARAYQEYIAFIPAALRLPSHPFFLHDLNSASPMSDSDFITHLRRLLTRFLGEEAAQFAGHSFRRGGVTALLQAGVPEAVIAVHGRWKSRAWEGYIDSQSNLRIRLAPTAQLRVCSSVP